MMHDTRSGCKPADFGAVIGPIWLAGWLFTIGYLSSPFWKAVLGLLLWPYFLGVSLR